ncbi:uncharacterized protein BT62DRAFT_1011044 [Guyanagaster necrorhizus]|uniref:Uncharacterized protein n=1 Tax=Guyanagaster necrorhizus TaxID=856835 RepID=A0A9P7VJ10_9AGAR|nr:uncharacterized protein BT62DRAFT_1011044 [Guyanagaster necrorhizus MCA 3950]KAG7442003.1 hypothetical protein BT62DRAFT_1011044 [Guyanagaster necrorhizus MCA 3950]
MSASEYYDTLFPFYPTYGTIPAGTDAFEDDDALNSQGETSLYFPPAFSGLATPPMERFNAAIPLYDPDFMMFAFPFDQPEESFVSPVNAFIPRPSVYDATAASYQEDFTQDIDFTGPMVVQREFTAPSATTMLATPPVTPQQRRTGKPRSSNRFEPYDLRDRSTGKCSEDLRPARSTSPSPSPRSTTRAQEGSANAPVVLKSDTVAASVPSSTPASSSTALKSGFTIKKKISRAKLGKKPLRKVPKAIPFTMTLRARKRRRQRYSV